MSNLVTAVENDPTPDEVLARVQKLRRKYEQEIVSAHSNFLAYRFRYRGRRREYVEARRVHQIRLDTLARVEAMAREELSGTTNQQSNDGK